MTVSGFKFGAKSLQRLEGVHPDLVACCYYALDVSPVDFVVLEGLRTFAQAAANAAKGVGIADSMHCYGLAVDCAAWVGGKISWEHRHYTEIARAFDQAFDALEVPGRNGCDWDGDRQYWERGEYDGPHHELKQPRRLGPHKPQSAKAAAWLAARLKEAA